MIILACIVVGWSLAVATFLSLCKAASLTPAPPDELLERETVMHVFVFDPEHVAEQDAHAMLRTLHEIDALPEVHAA